jgi:hypothetical protein
VLFSTNTTDGSRAVVSNFGNSDQGPLGTNPVQVVLSPSGDILVVDLDAGTGGKGALFRVNALNGNRTLVSDFGNAAQGPTGEDPVNLQSTPPEKSSWWTWTLARASRAGYSK